MWWLCVFWCWVVRLVYFKVDFLVRLYSIKLNFFFIDFGRMVWSMFLWNFVFKMLVYFRVICFRGSILFMWVRIIFLIDFGIIIFDMLILGVIMYIDFVLNGIEFLDVWIKFFWLRLNCLIFWISFFLGWMLFWWELRCEFVVGLINFGLFLGFFRWNWMFLFVISDNCFFLNSCCDMGLLLVKFFWCGFLLCVFKWFFLL